MPAARTDKPTSTNTPTRNSVQVSCLRCGISASSPLKKSLYRKFKPENASDRDLSNSQSHQALRRNKSPHPGTPGSASVPCLPLRCHCLNSPRPALLQLQNENEPTQTRLAIDVWP